MTIIHVDTRIIDPAVVRTTMTPSTTLDTPRRRSIIVVTATSAAAANAVAVANGAGVGGDRAVARKVVPAVPKVVAAAVTVGARIVASVSVNGTNITAATKLVREQGGDEIPRRAAEVMVAAAVATAPVGITTVIEMRMIPKRSVVRQAQQLPTRLNLRPLARHRGGVAIAKAVTEIAIVIVLLLTTIQLAKSEETRCTLPATTTMMTTIPASRKHRRARAVIAAVERRRQNTTVIITTTTITEKAVAGGRRARPAVNRATSGRGNDGTVRLRLRTATTARAARRGAGGTTTVGARIAVPTTVTTAAARHHARGAAVDRPRRLRKRSANVAKASHLRPKPSRHLPNQRRLCNKCCC